MKYPTDSNYFRIGILSGCNCWLVYAILMCALAMTDFSFAIMVEDIRFDNLTVREGASRDSVFDIVQDETGFLWFATKIGLFRYDGYTFVSFKHNPRDQQSLAYNVVHKLCLDLRGRLWIGLENGQVDRFNPRTNSFTHFTLPLSGVVGGQGVFIEDLFCDSKGATWVSTEQGGLYQYTNRSAEFRRISLQNRTGESISSQSILQIMEDSLGNYWFSMDRIGLVRFDADLLNPLVIPSTEGSSGDYYTILEDRRGRLWAGSWNGELFQIDLNNMRLNRVGTVSTPAHGEDLFQMSILLEDSNGNIWCGSDNDGIAIYNVDDGKFSYYGLISAQQVKGLNSNEINCLYEDHTGTVWVGTFNGINKFSRHQYKFSSMKISSDSLSNSGVMVTAFQEDSDGALWLGTIDNGLFRLDSNARLNKIFSLKDISNVAEDTILSLFVRDDVIYLGTSGLGLIRFDIGTNSYIRMTESTQIVSILVDRYDVIWFGTLSNGLGTIDPGSGEVSYWEPPRERIEAVKPFSVRVLMEDSLNNVWVGSDGEGLFKFLPNSSSYIAIRHDPDNQGTISDNSIYSLHEDSEGRIWIGSAQGLSRLNPDTFEVRRFYEKDGLSDNVICGILADTNGRLWLSTYNGICSYNPETEEYNSYGVRDGLLDLEYLRGSYYKSSKGTLYFGCVTGYNSFSPSQLPRNQNVPPVLITTFANIDRRWDFSNSSAYPDAISIPSSEAVFSIEFAAFDFSDSSRNRFEYRMEGLHDEWISNGTKRTVDFSRVPPGNYVFHVRGSNNDGVWNNQGTSLNITIVAPIWMRLEFRIFAFLMVVATIFLVHKLQIRAVKVQRNLLQKEVDERRIAEGSLLTNQERLRSLAAKMSIAEELERRRISGALHDNIGHSLFLSKVKLLNIKQTEKSDDKIHELNELIATIDEILHSTRALTVDISPPSLYKIGLESAVETMLEEFGKKYDIKTILSMEGESPLEHDVTVLVYQSFRELLVNVLKHAEASTIKVSIRNDGKYLQLKLRDDGNGFDVKKILEIGEETMSFGLFSIVERMETISGSCDIISKIGIGTEVTLLAPLKTGA